MKKLVFLILCLMSLHPVFGVDIWNTNTQDIRLSEDLKLGLVEEIRFVNDNVGTYIQYVGLKKKVNDNLSVVGWYKFVSSKKDHAYHESHRVVWDGVLKGKIYHLSLSNRFRFERDVVDNFWLYRNRTKVSKSAHVLGRKAKLFVSEEFFVRFRPDYKSLENRLCFGVNTNITKNSALSFAYMLRNKNGSRGWDRADIFCLNFSTYF